MHRVPLVTLLALVSIGLTASTACAAPVQLQTDLDHSVMHADSRQTGYLRIALTGDADSTARRAPMNVSIVLDKSSSMSGEKIARAKDAARAALDQLGPDDIVSVVAYDSTVQVLVPATKVSDRASILRGIDRLNAGGMTALFAGTSKGAAEVRKFFDRQRVNRIILLSDGQANVGPSTPGELGRLGDVLAREGVAVTTVGLGLGYNEDLMVELAERSGGQHAFVEHASELARFFERGFGSLAAIVAQEVVVEVTFEEGFRPLRVLGFDAEVTKDRLVVHLSQLYRAQTDELIVAFDADETDAGTRRIAEVSVRYHDLTTRGVAESTGSVSARFSDDPREVERSASSAVMVAVVSHVANERNREALRLRDEGRLEEAQKRLQDNMAYLSEEADRHKSKMLRDLRTYNKDDLDNLDGAKWNKQRKEMKKRQNKLRTRVYDFESSEHLF